MKRDAHCAVRELAHLADSSLQYTRVIVPQVGYSDAGGKIQVSTSVGCIKIDPLGPGGRQAGLVFRQAGRQPIFYLGNQLKITRAAGLRCVIDHISSSISSPVLVEYRIRDKPTDYCFCGFGV